MPAQLRFGAGDSTTFGTTGSNSASTIGFNTSSLSNIVVGDLLVAWIHNQTSASGTITPPSGWTRYGAAIGNPSLAASRNSGFYYYPVKAQSDITALGSTVTWSFTTGARVACVVARATGIDLANIEDTASTSFSTSSNTTSFSISAITTTNATTLLVAGLFHGNSASTSSPNTTSLLTGFQEYKTAPDGSTLANSAGVMGYQYLTTATTTGTVTANFDGTANSMGGELVAFRAGAWSPPVTTTRPTVTGTPTTYTTSSNVTSFTINKPTGVQDGDVLILAVSGQSQSITADFSSSGWSRVSQSFVSASATYRVVAFYALPVPTASSVTATSFTFTSTDATGGRIAAEMFIVRNANIASMIGATSPYGTTSSQSVTVQPGSPTTTTNLLLIAYNANFTATPDYTVATGPTGMTQQSFLTTSTGTASSKTVLAVYQQDVESGSLAADTLTWNGLQSQTSGAAIVIKPLGSGTTTPPSSGLSIKYTSATDTLSSGQLYFTSSTDTLSTPAEVRPFPSGYSSISAMLATSPFYVAHRGGSANWPEMSLFAYTQASYWGVGALEVSLARTSDGVWFGLHDATLDRTSGTSGFTASAHTWAEVQAYSITAAGTTNPSVGAKPYMRWEEIIAAYYNTSVLFVDPKAAISYTAELLNMMDALPNTSTNRLIAKYYGVVGNAANTTGWPHDASARGYKTWGYFYQSDSSNFATYQGRWDILGMDVTADQATWNTILSYGKPVIGHTPATSSDATMGFSKGASGLMCAGVQQAVPRTP